MYYEIFGMRRTGGIPQFECIKLHIGFELCSALLLSMIVVCVAASINTVMCRRRSCVVYWHPEVVHWECAEFVPFSALEHSLICVFSFSVLRWSGSDDHGL